MDEENKGGKKDNIKLLIKIILYLLLALAFFSDYAFKAETHLNFMIGIAFLFGILALICLYVGYYSNRTLNKVGKAFGCGFACAFISVFVWFIFNVLTSGHEGTRIEKLSNLLKSDTIWIALLIPSIILVIYLIVNYKKLKCCKS